MAKLLLTIQASTELDLLPPLECTHIRSTLIRLVKHRTSGIKLWGQDEIYTMETPWGTRVLYRLFEDDVQVLDIEPSRQMNNPLARLKLAAVVLAGGQSAHPEAIPFRTLADSFLAAGINDVVVVVSHSYGNAFKELQYHDVTLVTIDEHAGCLSHSLRCGLRFLAPNTQAVLLSLGNRPFVTQDIVTRVIRAFKTHATPIVVPIIDKTRGHPVLFDTCLLPELMKARGDVGGRAVLKHHNKELTQIEVTDTGIMERAWVN
ncbi:MAG: nucleotidyltransferase family protein [Dehalococcoidia bacterium]|nr:nucleotidyltransferase family protein [Dehalococcoidia bacterium]